jgi:hypothetical protein
MEYKAYIEITDDDEKLSLQICGDEELRDVAETFLSVIEDWLSDQGLERTDRLIPMDPRVN